MTLAHLLVRQARQRPDSPAILNGDALHATHHQWAARSAGLAQRTRDAGLKPRNHPRYLEVLWSLWWAGLVAVPVNAKLHPREVEWIAANCGARWAFVTADVAPETLGGIERQIDLESPQAAALLAPAPDPFAVPVTQRNLAVLHQRHHRPPQGRDADAPQPDDHGHGLPRRCRRGVSR